MQTGGDNGTAEMQGKDLFIDEEVTQGRKETDGGRRWMQDVCIL